MQKSDLAFYDLNVHAYPEGASSISSYMDTAKSYGYAGICISNHNDFFTDICRKYPGKGDFKVYLGVEVVAVKANELRRLVDKYRRKVDVLTVHGGDESINRAACEDDRVDILAHPHEGKTSGINHIIAKLAADKFVAIQFDLAPIIANSGGSRVRVLSNYRTNLRLVKKYGAPFVISSYPISIYDLRDVRSVISLAGLFGMTEEDAIKGISSYPSEILRRNLPGTGYIAEGVEVLDNSPE